jgi:hypothetical protein
MWFLLAIDIIQFVAIGWLANSVAKWVWICQEQGEHLKAVNAVLYRHAMHLKLMSEVVNGERETGSTS